MNNPLKLSSQDFVNLFQNKKVFFVDPVAKPRMTRSDKWKKRPCVLNYRAFKDQLRIMGASVSINDYVIFYIAMPDSWSAKRKKEMNGKPHQQTPDIDNLIKGFFDGLLTEDKQIWRVFSEKRWGYQGKIEVIPLEDFQIEGVAV